MRNGALTRRTTLVLVFGFLYLPIAVLVLLSFNESGLPTSWSGFSTKWYASLAQNNEILHAAWNTLIVAVFATLISIVLGTMLALGMEASRRKSNTLDALAFAPMGRLARLALGRAARRRVLRPGRLRRPRHAARAARGGARRAL